MVRNGGVRVCDQGAPFGRLSAEQARRRGMGDCCRRHLEEDGRTDVGGADSPRRLKSQLPSRTPCQLGECVAQILQSLSDLSPEVTID